MVCSIIKLMSLRATTHFSISSGQVHEQISKKRAGKIGSVEFELNPANITLSFRAFMFGRDCITFGKVKFENF